MKALLIALAVLTAFDAAVWSGTGREATLRWISHILYVVQSQDWRW